MQVFGLLSITHVAICQASVHANEIHKMYGKHMCSHASQNSPV